MLFHSHWCISNTLFFIKVPCTKSTSYGSIHMLTTLVFGSFGLLMAGTIWGLGLNSGKNQNSHFLRKENLDQKNSLSTVFVRTNVSLPGMNLLIILFLFLTSSDPGTQSSSLSSLLSLVLSLSAMVVSVLRFFTGVLRVREGRPAGTAGTGRPKREKIQI